jgi:acylphosphatase
MVKKRIRAVVKGRVQGVFFRAHAEEIARNLDLAGWVRNRPDGSVETVAEGEADRIAQFSQWLQHGPPAARVIEVEIKEEALQGELHRFDIQYQ